MSRRYHLMTLLIGISFNAASHANGIDAFTPVGFDASDDNKAAVMSFINTNVERIYCADNKVRCDSVFVVNKKQEDIDAFKELTQAHPAIVKDLLENHCRYDFSNCRYSEMLTDYKKLNEASAVKPHW